ncbi:hypothetical protein EUX98_g1869 [Antrodiella citrinella]|uniref:Chalcone isomerase domain-containing protein n=1 Tax=Antrodiella citrinella TaxID=2447956 RepID=A0A4S4N1X9_9APHY|nr:hypothetical protein EUX98_g1869 [Antrodiella citrinella]
MGNGSCSNCSVCADGNCAPGCPIVARSEGRYNKFVLLFLFRQSCLRRDDVVDPATSLAFPNTLRVQSKSPLPDFTLIGVGVRTVSFLGIQVYSIGFYADLKNPNLKIPKSATPEQKIEHIVRNTSCAFRIVPTRSTSYSHLRDGFMRALQARMVLCRQRGLLTQEEESDAQSPLRSFKSMFPNTALAKHTPLDILLLAPEPKQPRTLIVRDLGALHNDWVAQEFVMAYFEGKGLSPPLKNSVTDYLQDFGN